MKHRKVSQRRNQTSRQDNRLAADLIRQRAKEQKPTSAKDKRPRDQNVGGKEINLDHVLNEKQRVELPRIPDHRLPRRQPKQRDQGDFAVLPVAKRLAQRRFGCGTFVFHLFERRRLVHLQPDIQRNRQQNSRPQKRYPPAPGLKRRQHFARTIGVHHRNTSRVQFRDTWVMRVDIASDR